MIEDPGSNAFAADKQPLDIIRISNLDSLDGFVRSEAVNVYRQAFAQSPYNENFTQEEAVAALAIILERQGDLLFGAMGDRVVSITGGYQKSESTYFIEELAVAPEYQGRGYGRLTLDALLRLATTQGSQRFQVRTTTANTRAVNLYESKGFEREPITEAVAHRRIGGGITVDERVYLSKPPQVEASMPPASLRRLAVAYPSGNTTALVFDQLLSADRKLLNESIMRSWSATNPSQPEIEQCGFITSALDSEAVARVEMFGGEFCGNATRSAAWLVTGGEDYAGLIEVSGVAGPLWFRIESGDVTIEMPLPKDRRATQVVREGTLVQLDGIAQLVVTDVALRQAKTARQLLQELLTANSYGLADQSATGVSYFNPNTGKAEFCVWVKEVETIFDETACGSGTCAIGVATAAEARAAVNLPVIQPSGETIITGAEYDSNAARVLSSAITGRVKILYDGGLVTI